VLARTEPNSQREIAVMRKGLESGSDIRGAIATIMIAKQGMEL
jgi:hypothetical protein